MKFNNLTQQELCDRDVFELLLIDQMSDLSFPRYVLDEDVDNQIEVKMHEFDSHEDLKKFIVYSFLYNKFQDNYITFDVNNFDWNYINEFFLYRNIYPCAILHNLNELNINSLFFSNKKVLGISTSKIIKAPYINSNTLIFLPDPEFLGVLAIQSQYFKDPILPDLFGVGIFYPQNICIVKIGDDYDKSIDTSALTKRKFNVIDRRDSESTKDVEALPVRESLPYMNIARTPRTPEAQFQLDKNIEFEIEKIKNRKNCK